MEFDPKSQAIQAVRPTHAKLLEGKTIVLAIGNRLTLAAMALVPEITKASIGNYTTEAEATNTCHIKKPDLLMATETLEQGYGLSLIKSVKELSPDTRCLLFLERETQEVVRDAINAHCDAVCFQSSIGMGTAGDYMQALNTISTGNAYIPSAVKDAAGFDARPLPDLSVKELEVLRVLCTGLSNREIAETLVVSVETVKTHVSNLIQKFGCKDRTSVVITAIRAGF